MQRIHYGRTCVRKRISLTFLAKKLILWYEGLSQTLLSDATYFVYRAVTFFNEIIKATRVRSRPVYRLKIIARARSINDGFLALVRMLPSSSRQTRLHD